MVILVPSQIAIYDEVNLNHSTRPNKLINKNLTTIICVQLVPPPYL